VCPLYFISGVSAPQFAFSRILTFFLHRWARLSTAFVGKCTRCSTDDSDGVAVPLFFKGFKIPFWKKPTTAYHYKDLNPDLVASAASRLAQESRPDASLLAQDLTQVC
jgi:hypothetical protein